MIITVGLQRMAGRITAHIVLVIFLTFHDMTNSLLMSAVISNFFYLQ